MKDNDPDLFKKANSLRSLIANSKAANTHFRVHIDDDLHGKIYMSARGGDLIKGIITSANFTESGLKHKHEWGVLLEDPDHLRNVLDNIISVSSDALTLGEIDNIISRIDSYTREAGTPTFPKFNLEISNLFMKNKNNDFWFKQFNDLEYIAREIDSLLINSLQANYQITRNYGIGYHKEPNKKRYGFAKLDTNDKCLILRFGRKKNEEGVQNQIKLAERHNLVHRRSDWHMDEYKNELWIYLEWLKEERLSMNELKEFAQRAFEVKYSE